MPSLSEKRFLMSQCEKLTLPAKLAAGKSLSVSFDLVNTGTRAGIEVAQVHVRDCQAAVPRPVKVQGTFGYG